MFKSWEKDVAPGSSFTVNVTNDMRKLALLVISSAGFGRYLKWEEDSNGVKTTGGHRMTFLKSLEVSVNNISLYMVTPKWVLNYAPIPMLRETKTGFEEFKSYLLEYIRTASEDKTARAKDNLLSSLVSSRSDPDVKGTLSESEVLGNVWIFMFAGHETTASTLAYAIALLGFYPEKQAKLHRFVDEVLKGRIPTYKEAGELHYVFAIMNETLRLFPPVINVPKWTARSPKTLSNGIQLPADTSINLNVAALHYHPRAWAPDPEAFRPERWNAPPSTSPTSASDEHSPTRATSQHPPGSFIPFSDGPRACIGKRFSQVEFVCALALIAQRYSWKPVPGAKLEETLESESRLTLRTVKDVEMIFTKRAV
ncbi:hypothetical protein HK104_005281 [Borealophlyctis nickersoniae]|nr:hypothetical protein HK104_005281 [Borealophlyctis nickersoniae]